jgi:hypothetical protein
MTISSIRKQSAAQTTVETSEKYVLILKNSFGGAEKNSERKKAKIAMLCERSYNSLKGCC